MPFSPNSLQRLSCELASHEGHLGQDQSQSRDLRRRQGAFFTPEPLIRFVVERVLDQWFSGREVIWRDDGSPALRILDPSAGDGRFLAYVTEALVVRAVAQGFPGGAARVSIERNCLVAIERDPSYAALVREALGGHAEVHCAEALLSGVVADHSVDIVVGNPPYLRSINLGRSDDELRQKLRGAYAATSHGEWDLYAAFLEQGMNWLRPGGAIAVVVPSRWWTAQWAGKLRKRFAEAGGVRVLVDFGSDQIFSDATVYTSLFFGAKERSEELTVSRKIDGCWETDRVRTEELGEAPWRLAVGADRVLFQQLAQGPCLGEIAHIKKGAGTNADAVYVIEEHQPIEEQLLRPLLRGRDVRSYGDVPVWPKLLVPYGRDGSLIEPAVMERDFPNAFEHLCGHRVRLESREKGRFAGDAFYCFGRPQNMAFLGDSAAKVVVPDVTKEGRALIDRGAAMVLDSAYALRLCEAVDLSLETLCGIMNSPMVGMWLRHNGVPLRGGYTRMKTAYLRTMPMPRPGPLRDRIGEAVCAGLGPECISERVRLALGVTEEQWRV